MQRTVLSIRRTLLALSVVLLVPTMLAMSTPVLAAPLISLSPTSGAIGTEVTLTGTNFQSFSGDEVSIFFDDVQLDNSPFIVPESGEFTFNFLVPDSAEPGRHEIIASSSLVPKLVSHLFIIPETEILLDISVGNIGSTVNIAGAGFYSGRLVTIHYHNRIVEQVGTEIASPIGEFSYRFVIPASPAGKHLITAENVEGNSASAEFEVIPSTTLSQVSGAVGELLTVRGIGFEYNSMVTIQLGNREVAKPKTDQYGSFEVTFNIPNLKPDTYDIKAIDEENNIHRVDFTITAGASLDQTTGSVSALLTVSGSGFKPNETVNISYDNVPIATAPTDNDGAFDSAFRVPVSPSGSHLITVTDGSITRHLTFNVESEAPSVPRLRLPVNMSPTKSRVYLDWEEVVDPSQPVTYSLQIASDQNFADIVVEKTGLTKSEYTLSEEEKLSTKEKDSHYFWRLKAIDSATNDSEWSTPWSFYVPAPMAPAPLLPETDTRPETKQIRFDWHDVTSLNQPVTYNLQVAADDSFTAIILDKKGLTQSEYTLTEEEELEAVKQEAPYYWRVKAIDGAENESKWSTPRPFYVGFSFAPPGWLLYTLIILGVILLAILAFWLGRRTAYYHNE